MKNSIMALVLLALLPATLQAAQSPNSREASGTIRFSGKIAAPTCEINRDNGKFISSCYRENRDKTFGYITTSVDEMSSELVSPATTEIINNNPLHKRVTISYN
ncbi:hypothetical protein [Serratia proteamaculans]|uniref:hypothetical protein n=1 Tax=Serratia proteamaculans TaxID=28151 RepID=UPI0009F7ABA4|nr:hypothetical protein [Serratia proteamaculans]SMB36436.1 conserved exported hypothetical protein [Serratia proteamaculans]